MLEWDQEVGPSVSLFLAVSPFHNDNTRWADSIYRCHLTSIGNLIVEIRRSCDRLISTMGFPMLVRRHFLYWIKSLCMVVPTQCLPFPQQPQDWASMMTSQRAWKPMKMNRHSRPNFDTTGSSRNPRALLRTARSNVAHIDIPSKCY